MTDAATYLVLFKTVRQKEVKGIIFVHKYIQILFLLRLMNSAEDVSTFEYTKDRSKNLGVKISKRDLVFLVGQTIPQRANLV